MAYVKKKKKTEGKGKVPSGPTEKEKKTAQKDHNLWGWVWKN
jgi:hypothetical protein